MMVIKKEKQFLVFSLIFCILLAASFCSADDTQDSITWPKVTEFTQSRKLKKIEPQGNLSDSKALLYLPHDALSEIEYKLVIKLPNGEKHRVTLNKNTRTFDEKK